jgi:alkylation response protein AidB-like acyl-CoA dehydrogenase
MCCCTGFARGHESWLGDLVIEPSVQMPHEWDQVIEMIARSAADSDGHGVPRSHFDELAKVGAHGAPNESSLQRELTERIAGADASTWFCWAQHQTPLKTLQAGGNQPDSEDIRTRWLPGLESGELLAAVAFAHIRRPGPANPVALEVNGKWELEGTLDWVTSWDIADVVMIMAATEDKDLIVTFFIPTKEFEKKCIGSRVDAPLQLLAMGGTHTRPVHFDHSVIPTEYVFSIQSMNEWLAADAMKTILPNPAALGVARAAIDELAATGEKRGSEVILATASFLAERFMRVRARAYAILDAPQDFSREKAISCRVDILELARTCTEAVVIAQAGAAMMTGRSAERRVREAMFLQVQAQTNETRNAALKELIDGD